MAIKSNLSVTGNEAQFNENVLFLKDVKIKGTLTVPDIFGDPNTTFHNKVTFLDIVTFNQDLSFPLLEIRDRLNVGVGGTLITADTRLNPGKVGIGTTQPSALLDVNGRAKIINLDLTTLNVSGLSTFIGITTQKSTLFSTQLSNSGVSTFFDTINVKTSGGSVIQDASGTLDLRSNLITLTNNDDSQNYAVFTNGEGVELLHNNVKKFHTTGIGVSVLGDLIVPDVGIRTSRVGLGTLIPADPTTIKDLDDVANGPLRLDVSGSALAVKNIYDREGSTGLNNYYLRRDQFGIRWAAVPPGAGLLGILLQNEGADVPVGLAQTFSTINFVQSNSLGLGTDGLLATAQNDVNPTGLATVFTNDYWGYQYDSVSNGINSPIYRMTKVGINVNNPQYQLDVNGTLHAADDVQFDKKLTVNGEALFKDNVNIRADGKFFTIETLTGTDKFTVATDTGNTVIQGTLDVTGVSNFNNTTDATNSTSGGSVTIDGGAAVAKKLFVGSDFDVSSSGVSNFNSTSDASSSTSGGSVTIDGGTGIAKKLFVGGNTKIESTTDATDASADAALQVVGGAAIGKDLFVGIDLDVKGNTQLGDAATDSLTVNAESTFKANVTAEKNVDIEENLDVDGHTELDNLNVTGVSTFGPGITTQKSTLFANQLSVVGVSTFIGITTQKSTLFTNQSSAVGVATFKNTIDIDADIKDQNDDTGTSVAASLSGNITGATYNSTTGVMVVTIANHGFENGDSILIPDESITFSCTYKGSTINQKYPRSKDPNSGRWLVISNKTANTFEVNVSDGGLSAGVAHAFVSATSGVIHSSGQKVKNDYRLASVGTGVSWRPSGVQTKRTIWVSKSGSDTNSGLLEGDAKATIGAAAAIAVETDTIKIRPGVYEENNPIGLRTDVSVTGEDLRLCIIKPKNKDKDVFHVRRGCLIENLNFGGSNVGVGYDGSACVAFPPPAGSTSAVSGYTDPGPANEGPSGRWRSPYVRNCTNFMTSSIGMKIDGDHADGAFTGINSVGADLKSMVCDSFTQYNENGIGVSLTNNGYAQLVSIFTINTDIAIFASSGAQCDLTNSNSSFGNFGLVAVGLGSTQYTGTVSNTDPSGQIIGSTNAENQDTVVAVGVTDIDNNVRRPFDGQALYFKIKTNNYPDVNATGNPNIDADGRITKPLERLSSVKLRNVDLSGFSPIDPPSVLIIDADDNTLEPKGPQAIIAEATATISPAGELTEINVVAQGRNYLSGQNLVVDIEGDRTLADPIMEPIFFTVESATEPVAVSGITTITFNEFIPYELFPEDPFSLQRISRILTSSHSFEYVGTGTDINRATPLQGAIPIKANEVVAKDGAQIPFTSTDQKGNFDIGQGLQINQTTSSITGRDFSRSIQAEVTPLILALR